MKKSISVKPINEIELAFDGGGTILLRFDVQSLMYLQEAEDLKNITKKSIPELCALLLYAGGTAHNEGLDLEKARELVSCMDIDTVSAIINEFSGSMGTDIDETSKKMMAQFLKGLR